MFNDFFIRLSLETLPEETSFFENEGLNPEIFIPSAWISSATSTSIDSMGELVSRFPSHTIHAPFVDILPGSQNREIRDSSFNQLNRVMEIARKWKSRLVVMHYNYDPIYYRFNRDGWLDRSADFFRRLLDPDSPVKIALENVADPTPYIAIQLLERIGDDRAVHCLDLGHQHVFSILPFDEWLYYLKPRGHIHFHFHDNDGGEDDHLPLGEGTIDWQNVRVSLTELNRPFSIALEPHNRENLKRTLDFYRKFFL